jgi:hypothetical protein
LNFWWAISKWPCRFYYGMKTRRDHPFKLNGSPRQNTVSFVSLFKRVRRDPSMSHFEAPSLASTIQQKVSHGCLPVNNHDIDHLFNHDKRRKYAIVWTYQPSNTWYGKQQLKSNSNSNSVLWQHLCCWSVSHVRLHELHVDQSPALHVC